GIGYATPFVYDALVGFQLPIEARNQTVGSSAYAFQSWSDTGAQQHVIVVPSSNQSFSATYSVTASATPTFVQVNSATPQTPQTTVSVPYVGAQAGGNLNVVAIGFFNATSTIASVTDSAGNVYQPAAPLTRGTGMSQAIYYAANIKAAAPGSN